MELLRNHQVWVKIAVLRMGNITNVGTIDYSNLVYSSNDEDIEQYSLGKKRFTVNRTNSSEWVGKNGNLQGRTTSHICRLSYSY